MCALVPGHKVGTQVKGNEKENDLVKEETSFYWR